jgi:hypothetical protein
MRVAYVVRCWSRASEAIVIVGTKNADSSFKMNEKSPRPGKDSSHQADLI